MMQAWSEVVVKLCSHAQTQHRYDDRHLKLGLDDAAEGGWFKEWMKSSTGAANAKSDTAPTSSAPVPTSVCFSRLITGFTCMQSEFVVGEK